MDEWVPDEPTNITLRQEKKYVYDSTFDKCEEGCNEEELVDEGMEVSGDISAVDKFLEERMKRRGGWDMGSL